MGSLKDGPADRAIAADPEILSDIHLPAYATGSASWSTPVERGNFITVAFHELTRLCVHCSETCVPDPFLLAIILTFVTAAIAVGFSGSSAFQILDAWYGGLWDVMPFAMQMALILSTGVALAKSPVVKRALRCLAGLPNGQTAAAITVFLTAAISCWFNWGFGLVVGALLAREIAKKLRPVDFSFLVAAAYMGFMVWASGLSSSIALATATHGSALNFVERITGHTAGFDQTILCMANLVPVLLLFVAIPAALALMAPSVGDMKCVDPETLIRQDQADEADWIQYQRRDTYATRLERAWFITLPVVLVGGVYEWHVISTRGFSVDIDGFIFAALLVGMGLHAKPIAYVHAFYAAARTAGPILLQFPIYGGIMGIMAHTGMAGLIARTAFTAATSHTLAFWAFVSSCIISLFVPSGGGQWAVVGPVVVPAALSLGADPALAAVGTAMGVQTASMIQPFWALPVLAVARLGLKDIMGYCVIGLIVAGIAYGGSLLLFGR
jgi:short-chain fatty acids transporter